ncbi:MAG: hypothetical protein AAF660_01715 [Pseudomonadota bacterium]
MIVQNQLALVKRELWEHRAIYLTPLSIAAVMILAALTGQVSLSAFGSAVEIAMMGAHELDVDPEAHRALLTGAVSGLGGVFLVAMWILTIFYCLDALYAERKDKSILFWRSLPVTDAETVISKLVVAVAVIPLVTFLVIALTQLVTLILTSIWLSFVGGNASLLIWQALDLVDIWGGTLILVFAIPLWLSPFIGWYLLVSAWTRRAPLAVAFLPIFILPMIEKIILDTTLFANLFFERTFAIIELIEVFGDGIEDFVESDIAVDPSSISLVGAIDLGGFVLNPHLWGGIIVCALFIGAAIWVRRYRAEA